VECISGTFAGFARPRRAVKPNAAWRRAEGAGLTAKARTEQSSMSPQYASSSDTVREIKYQILQLFQSSSDCGGASAQAWFFDLSQSARRPP
jgi:hypothetical protein